MIAISIPRKRVHMKGDLRTCYSRLKEMWRRTDLIRYHFPIRTTNPIDLGDRILPGILMPREEHWTVTFEGTCDDRIRWLDVSETT